MMKNVAQGFDLRMTVFGSFYRVGFDLHDLTPREKQRMEIIQLYPYLMNGEIWFDIMEELQDLVSSAISYIYRMCVPLQMIVIG